MSKGTKFIPLMNSRDPMSGIRCDRCYDAYKVPSVHLYKLIRDSEDCVFTFGNRIVDEKIKVRNKNHITIPMLSLDGNDKSSARTQLHMNRNDALDLYKLLGWYLGIEPNQESE